MKRTLIGAVLAFLGTFWGTAVFVCAGSRLTDGWSTPPGRFLTTVAETGMALPLILAVLLFLCGLLILAVEFFKKEA